MHYIFRNSYTNTSSILGPHWILGALKLTIAQHRFRDNANMKAFDVVGNYNAVAILALVALK